ncbi:MAG TPA: NAD/NADP octopine/nopaline dehydrogenase family protein [Tissierellales bacterium]|nr:NAD/NADP octopine/nopaline dehydrogenase family protein [Tissierellales bacterium]
MKLGIYGVSTQGGKAFLADFLIKGYDVYGYARPSQHGLEFINEVQSKKGIMLERPKDITEEKSRFLKLNNSKVGCDLNELVEHSDIIVISHPSQYIVETVANLKEAGIIKKRTPLILGCSRTLATPYVWNILGGNYPVICFSTLPYSAKSPYPGIVYIKRRKRNWMASVEGEFKDEDIDLIETIFPQVLYNNIPASTSLGNIGAVFHAAPYILNYEDIKESEKRGEAYSFYMQGIAARSDVGECIEGIDQTRLHIASYLDLSVFDSSIPSREVRWKEIMNHMRMAELEHMDNINELRVLRHDYLKEVNNAILSAQHWLDVTYGVRRIEGESICSAIKRTPTYQKMSVPQKRYVEEDIPTGLVPLEALAKRFNIRHDEITYIIDLYDEKFNIDSRAIGRNLKQIETKFLIKYLKGDLFGSYDYAI